MFAVQEEIASAIAARLSVRLGAVRPRADRPPSKSIEAYELYLKGRHFVQQRGAGMAQAIDSFHRAIAHDPEYAQAYAGLAEAYAVLALYDVVASPIALTRARSAAERAVALDPTLAECHVALGLMELYLGWNLQRCEESLRRAVELAPEQAAPHVWLSMLYAFSGRGDEARPEARLAVELEPHGALTTMLAGNSIAAAGDPGGGLELIERGLGLGQGLVAGYYLQGMTRLMLARPAEALVSFDEGLRLVDSIMLHCLRGLALQWMGRSEEAREVARVIGERAQRTQRGHAPLAGLLWQLDERDQAFAAMQQAFDDHEAVVWSYPVWVPGMRGFAEDPRWDALLVSAGLAHLRRAGATERRRVLT